MRDMKEEVESVVSDLSFIIQVGDFNRKNVLSLLKRKKMNVSASKIIELYNEKSEYLKEFEYRNKVRKRREVLETIILELKRDWNINEIYK